MNEHISLANAVLAKHELHIGMASKFDVLRAHRLANEEGSIPADRMRMLSIEPAQQVATSLRTVLLRFGCTDAAGLKDLSITYYRNGNTYAAIASRGKSKIVGIGECIPEAVDEMGTTPFGPHDDDIRALRWVTSLWSNSDAADGEWVEVGEDGETLQAGTEA